MIRKIVSCVLVASLSLYIGCYSTEMVSKDELKAKTEQVDITVVTKDFLEYKFSQKNYRIQGDTLSGYGIRKGNMSAGIALDARLSFADMTSIESTEFSLVRTILLCSAVGLGVLYWIARPNSTGGTGVMTGSSPP